MVAEVDPARGSALNERELWREMVRWAGGRIAEQGGVLLGSGPSAYLRVAMRSEPGVAGAAAVARAIEFFGAEPAGFIVLVRRPDDADIERAALMNALSWITAAWWRWPTMIRVSARGHRCWFHDETILAPHIAAFVAYIGTDPVACAMAL